MLRLTIEFYKDEWFIDPYEQYVKRVVSSTDDEPQTIAFDCLTHDELVEVYDSLEVRMYEVDTLMKTIETLIEETRPKAVEHAEGIVIPPKQGLWNV